jgi:hypothetical protein
LTDILLGYEIDSGEPVRIPIRHLAVTGQTQQSGKTTTLEGLVARSGMTALTFITKRGETSFERGRRVTPYFRDRADWQFVTSILDATLQEKNKFLRPWIMKICQTTRTLAEVQDRVREALKTAKGLNEGVYTQLDAYLDLIVPEIGRARLADKLDLHKGLNVMDVSGFATPMQMLFIQSALDWVNEHCRDTIVVIPEAWEFVPEGKGSPVKASAITLVRKGSGIGNHIWIDSQDMAGVDKTILRGCTVWLMGVQREANEIKRNLLNIPAGISKPPASQIALLERGQFFACFGRTVVKVYVQPEWMGADEARAVAMGLVSVSAPPAPSVHRKQMEKEVTEAEAAALRAENEELKRRLAALEARSASVAAPLPETHKGATLEISDFEVLYDAIKRRAMQDHILLKVLVDKPELEITVQRRTVQMDGTSAKGRIARLIADGFFDAGATQTAVRTQLKRTGADVNSGNISTIVGSLHKDGFLTCDGNIYRAVPGMKVNIVEAR